MAVTTVTYDRQVDVTPSTGDLTIASAIRAARQRTGMSQRALSVAAGLSQSYVSKVEAGTLEPSVRAFGRMAHVLKLNMMEIALCVLAEGARENRTQ